MDYGMGNAGAQYPQMDAYGAMSLPDGHAVEMGQEFMQPRGYGGEMQSYNESRNCQSSSASFGGPGYRSPLRYTKVLREMNSRNGLYSPAEKRAGRGNGDYHNSMHGMGAPEGQSYGLAPQGGNPYF